MIQERLGYDRTASISKFLIRKTTEIFFLLHVHCRSAGDLARMVCLQSERPLPGALLLTMGGKSSPSGHTRD